jgi:UrcA family protein
MLSHNRNIHLIVAVVSAAALMIWPIEPVKAVILHPRASSVTVRFHSADLETPQGVAGLYRHIRAAAESVCGQPDDTLLYKRIWDQCVDQAIAGAVTSVHSESLSAYRGLRPRGRKWLLVEAPKSLAVPEPVAR